MARSIHATSTVSPQAELGNDVSIGPYCTIDASAVIGDNTELRSHVVIGPHTILGVNNTVYPFVSLGLEPQDLKFGQEVTRCEIGDRNTFREGVTVNRGTEKGGAITRIGNDNFMMTSAHIAHDCQVGDKNIFANHATLAGHVELGSECNIGAFSAVHQFCRVGNHAFLGGFTVATLDCMPYMKTVGARGTKSYGVNSIGLERKGFSRDQIAKLKEAHRILFHSDLDRDQGLIEIVDKLGNHAEITYLADFIKQSVRGIHRG